MGRLTVGSLVTFIPYAGATWRITGMSPARISEEFQGRTLSTTRSFRPLDEAERSSIVETSLALVQARAGESLDRLAERTGSAWDARTLAVQNGVFVDHRFRGGEAVKIALSRPYLTPPKKGAGK
jgi:predicted Zn-dependent protease